MSTIDTRSVTFVYDYNQVYLHDQDLEWSDDQDLYTDALEDANRRGISVGIADGLVDLLMARMDNFEAPLELQICSAEPELDEGGWEHIVEFPLDLPSGVLVLSASGGSGDESVDLPAGKYKARWSGNGLAEAADWEYPEDDEDANPPDSYRLQLWPSTDEVALREIKRSASYG